MFALRGWTRHRIRRSPRQIRLPALRDAAGQRAGMAPAFLGAARRQQGNPSGARSLV